VGTNVCSCSLLLAPARHAERQAGPVCGFSCPAAACCCCRPYCGTTIQSAELQGVLRSHQRCSPARQLLLLGGHMYSVASALCAVCFSRPGAWHSYLQSPFVCMVTPAPLSLTHTIHTHALRPCWLQALDPDALVGWDVQQGSLGYLGDRAKLAEVNLLREVSRTPQVGHARATGAAGACGMAAGRQGLSGDQGGP
jgi:hypothetical protein